MKSHDVKNRYLPKVNMCYKYFINQEESVTVSDFRTNEQSCFLKYGFINSSQRRQLIGDIYILYTNVEPDPNIMMSSKKKALTIISFCPGVYLFLVLSLP